MKTCKKCNTSKVLDDFHKDKTTYDGLTSKCKSCKKQYNIDNKEYISDRHKNYYILNKGDHQERMKIWLKNNKEKAKEICKRWEENNKEKIQEYHKIYDKENIHKKKIRYSLKYKNDINFKILEIHRKRIVGALKNKGFKKSSSSIQLLGCSIEEFKQYIESQFYPEMNWGNHGPVWELDHIIPCAVFNFEKLEEQELCFHYTNQRPLFKTTNIALSFGYKDEIGNRNRSKIKNK
jgi:hypothetical protein